MTGISRGGTRTPLDGNGDIITGVLLGGALILDAIGSIPDPVSLLESIEVRCGIPACYCDDGTYIGLPN